MKRLLEYPQDCREVIAAKKLAEEVLNEPISQTKVPLSIFHQVHLVARNPTFGDREVQEYIINIKFPESKVE